MMVRLHKNATTTPATRRYIQSSNLPVRRLARELGVSEDTIRRWVSERYQIALRFNRYDICLGVEEEIDG